MVEKSARRPKKSSPIRGVALLVLIVLTILAMVVFVYLQLRTDVVMETEKKGLPLKVLFVMSEGGEARFLELFAYHPVTHKGAVFHIPGNVGSIIESLNKVDEIRVLYDPQDLDPIRKKVEELLGTEIPFHVDLQRENATRIVDLIGGIEVFMPNPVDLELSDRRILLPSGSKVLDGDKACDFLFYEEDLESETDRVVRRQKFIQSLLRRLGEMGGFILQKDPFEQLRKDFRANLSARALRSLVGGVTEFNSERVILQRVTGNVRMVDGKELLFPHHESQLLKISMRQILETLQSGEIADDEERAIGVEVLNGTNVTGLASRTAQLFQSYGFDVVSVGNADNSEHGETVVLDRKSRLDLAERVADIIRCRRYHTSMDPNLDVSIDVTVILGKDFDGRYCEE